MFTIDAAITDLKVKERNLFKVFFSMNNHQVANPEMSLEEARSYVFFFKDGGKYQAYVGLYFIPSDRRMFYSYSSPSFGESEMADVEEEARSFAEGLGAMLDEIHFSGLSAEDRNNWIDAQEMLNQKVKRPEPVPDPVAAVMPEPVAAVEPPSLEQPSPSPAPQPAVQQDPQLLQAAMQAAPAPEAFPQPARTAVPVTPQPTPAISQAMPQPGPRVLQPSDQAAAQAPIVQDVEVQDVELPAPRPRLPKKQSAPVREEAADFEDNAAGMSGAASADSIDDVLDQAVRAGVVRAPKARLKKEIRTSTGSIGREKEALARLLSSF